jgi:hypothetical protein
MRQTSIVVRLSIFLLVFQLVFIIHIYKINISVCYSCKYNSLGIQFIHIELLKGAIIFIKMNKYLTNQ